MKKTKLNTNTKKIKEMNYVEFMAFLGETNRPPGGKEYLRLMAQNTFLHNKSKFLHIGCNTGSSSIELIHLVKCSAVAVDISSDMIKSAIKINKIDKYYDNIKFEVANAENLPFENETFDLVFSAGSMAFINNKKKAVNEEIRVTKNWGFISDIVLFYHEIPPKKILNNINGLMNTKIEPWDLNYWKNLYAKEGLEEYFIKTNKMIYNDESTINNYCKKMTKFIEDKNEQKEAEKKLYNIMNLFNENHKYLSNALLIYRKRQEKEQIALFGY